MACTLQYEGKRKNINLGGNAPVTNILSEAARAFSLTGAWTVNISQNLYCFPHTRSLASTPTRRSSTQILQIGPQEADPGPFHDPRAVWSSN